ncbi:MAG: hypothetical protein AB7E51_08725 [Pseudodesulfovibrio sp.]|uniref:Lipoprotein n=1 Tax=Pseudodesulfovibrio indicus TaxID=1716143 RepID=A0A126QPY9_9BACT|nr:hypothetical protein [Pseudodesulfovibrio indicus]AMK11788.1 hypothetical protein AWY79_12010 [Pseudodesulfovibrio indicus]TDT88327.1 hypothetical protein EDC59_106140 [Pseudodesulfovibrio indicus]
MRRPVALFLLLAFGLAVFAGCALGRKKWPSAVSSEDAFTLSVTQATRQDDCLAVQVMVKGAVNRLWRASILYEPVGSADDQGCEGCPFVPRAAEHFTRGQDGFRLEGNYLNLGMCGMEPGVEYRFRVSGKSELPSMPLEYTDVYVAEP